MIWHIISKKDWQTAVTQYTPPSLQTEGFIHCSTREQILYPANERYHGRTDLLLLGINEAQVEANIIYEDCYETGIQFPHIYGPLNTNAVTQVIPFPPNHDGSFSLPPNI